LERATHWLLGSQRNDLDAALAGATPYLRLFALTAGGALLAEEALAAMRLSGNGADAAGRTAIARFFAENVAAPGRDPAAPRGGGPVSGNRGRRARAGR